MTFESSHRLICELVKDFKINNANYMSPSYQEAEVRRDFIDKFFEALGWDVYHKQQKNPYEQEVKVEKGVSIGRAQKRADYAFFISPEFRTPKFFAEAKKPSRNLKNADDYFQTIRYGWNANTPVAVLTDFQELHILDCRIKPNINTVLANSSHKSYYLDDYLDTEKFSEIYYLFSHEAVAGGSLEKYSGSLAKPKGKIKSGTKTIQAIDEDFLEYIDGIRERLAKAFKKNDESLSSEELTEATQRTIDRLVFIRFLEDKLIEPQNIISEFGRRGDAFKDFISASRSLDSKYNGIVFKEHFIDRKDFKGPDEAEFKKICEEFSHLNSPYDFNAIPVHIIGSIYERFLGKVVNATAHRVKVEEKPEVRKAGGVYYTPKYIVDYIVENTVGKIIRNETDTANVETGHALSAGRSAFQADESPKDSDSIPQDSPTVPLRRGIKGEATGKTPAEISKLRFADIACGSGSFLIGVFETLLKYQTEYYNRNPEQAKKDGCIEKDGAYILSIKQKQKILQNNIYGVDIDMQAVEVTQLSLALKMLEDETTATANEMQVLFHEKILPNLSKNIVCGNSLIGTDILEGKMFGTEEERKLNPMDFETTFPEVFANGGFDAIVGNPPYGFRQIYEQNIKEYFKKHYISSHGSYENYIIFYEKSLSLLKKEGYHGYIVPVTWLTIPSAKSLRKYILENYSISKINWLPKFVFKNAKVNTLISVIKKSNYDITEINIYENDKFFLKPKETIVKEQKLFIDNNYNINIFDNDLESEIISKIQISTATLDMFCRPCSGYNPYEVGKGIAPNGKAHTKETVKEKPYHSNYQIDSDWKCEVIGRNLSRYYLQKKNDRWIKYGNWLAAPRDRTNFIGKRILVQEITGGIDKRIIAVYVEDEIYHSRDIIPIKFDISEINPYFILALLNSKLISWFHLKRNPKAQKGLFPKVLVGDLAKLPIKEINFKDESEKQAHDKIVSLVEQMLEAKKQLHGSKTEKDKTYFERKCDSLDKQIDAEVYKLYGLTEDEIKIVEG